MPPESGTVRCVDSASCALTAAGVTAPVWPDMMSSRESTGMRPDDWLALAFGFGFTDGANFLVIAAYRASSAADAFDVVSTYEPPSSLPKVEKMLGSRQVLITYFGSVRPSVW